MRKKYQGRLWFRVLVLLAVTVIYVVRPEQFAVLEPGHFFAGPSALHLLWIIWMGDMVLKLFPIPGTLALGAAKQLPAYYVPAKKPAKPQVQNAYFRENNRRALVVFMVWSFVGLGLAGLWKLGILGNEELLLVTVFFYVSDLFCVVVWCPFRVWFLKNRCCTTCRIFNWDHLMMVTPLVCVNSFYSWSLVVAASFVLLLWEYRVYRYPQRFFEGSNEALKCKNCTDLLCGRRKTTGEGAKKP
ncbi:MAG: hypothetical protein HFI33_12415 [Lachnospiraceae bacterium]|nr:hypothetical protein [Lachnospiraceae bacterium]